ncbi:LacI family transcriptional regulator [Kocuria rosea]|uniref:LacI family DNA-binding transcriptional regulator n=1 Tax=Kocuria TaxID=57493 RepID=UPI000D6557DE|nr:LacI family DNA-binding transcriptional regulator [Kocuria rosea]PWF87240.1 LacI family transcriptional regulator [Kocuria rosea]QCY34242.1 LacI family transcriptional regulator [Kocuria rosea]TQN38478.1 LacI family transcriptional regulator [Kocuria rosea]
MKRTTLSQVAAQAGVSKGTVSKVLNGRPDVGEDTRERVRAAVADLGYTGSAARRPRTAIVLVFDTLESNYSLQVMAGAVDACGRAEADLMLSTLPSLEQGDVSPFSEDWFARCGRTGETAVIAVTTPLTAEQVAAAAHAQVPLVAIDPVNSLPSTVPSIGSTNWAGGHEATTHLLGLGHRRIGHLSGAGGSVPARERLAGYRSALEDAGVPHDPGLVTGGGFSYEAGFAGAQELLELEDPPTALFAASDEAALGAFEAARQAGLRVPEDLSVVGFDDTLLARWASPKLTTVRQPLHAMGEMAVERAITLLAGGSRRVHPLQLQTSLVERSSTAAPRGAADGVVTPG